MRRKQGGCPWGRSRALISARITMQKHLYVDNHLAGREEIYNLICHWELHVILAGDWHHFICARFPASHLLCPSPGIVSSDRLIQSAGFWMPLTTGRVINLDSHNWIQGWLLATLCAGSPKCTYSLRAAALNGLHRQSCLRRLLGMQGALRALIACSSWGLDYETREKMKIDPLTLSD